LRSASDVTVRDIYVARRRIAPIVRRTPLIASPLLSEQIGAPVYLKLENVQETGAFKLRGAANKILSLTADEKERGVIAFSSGNHGLAVTYVARHLHINAVICISERVPSTKVDNIKRLAAEVVVSGKSQDEAEERSFGIQEERALTMIPPSDDPLVIAGQGTIGLELLEDLPEIDTAIVPLSGGGLISGVALALKSADPEIRVIGVSMERAPVMYYSLRAGKPVKMEEEETIADGLVGGIGLDNRYTFRMVQEYVDDTVLVSEEEIAGAMLFALEKHHLVMEGAGAVGVAALLYGKVRETRHNVAVVITGSNVDLPLLLEIADRQSSRHDSAWRTS
jgi:threonine dehydratase